MAADSDGERIETARRRNLVVQLREAGAGWEDIANSIERKYGEERLPSGWDRRYAYKDFHRRLDAIERESEEAAKNVREMELRRLNRMMRSIWQEATGDGNATWKQQKDAVDRVLRIMKRRAKLLGLDDLGELTLNTGEVDWEDLTDEELMRVAEGEAIQEVLADRDGQ